jgi:hypothetical protein
VRQARPLDDGGLSVALIDPYYGTTANLTPLAKIVASFPPELGDVDAIVFRETDSIELSPESAEELTEALRSKYAIDIEICVLSLARVDGSYTMTCRHVAGPRVGTESMLNQLRQLEMAAQIERAGVVYRPPHAHVLLPSGSHADAYVRVADLFDDLPSIQRVADWLDDKVNTKTILLADSWTIMPLLQELSRRHTDFRSSPRTAAAPPIHSFVSYPDHDEVRRTFEQIAAQAVSRQDRVLLIMSVVSSGDLLKNVRSLGERHLPGIALDIVAIVNTDSSTTVEHLGMLRNIRRFPAGACELCESPETQALVSIDPKRYFPSFKGRRSTEMITSAVAGEHRSFWEIADRCNAIRVHADVRLGSPGDLPSLAGPSAELKHRVIAIDVVALLKDRAFRESVLESLSKFLARCDLVIVPDHHASTALLDLTRELYPNVKTIILKRPWETDGRTQLVSGLHGARRIMVLDDTVVSGRTIRVLHRLIQDVIHDLPKTDQPAKDYEICGFAIIGRPYSEAQWNRLSDSLRQSGSRSSLHCHLKILMPDGFCPWCDERDRLETVRRRLASGPLFGAPAVSDEAREELALLDARLAILDAPQSGGLSGLDRSLFVCGTDGAIAVRDSDRLTWHSLFGEQLAEATTYAAVATAMHAVRVKAASKQQEQQATTWAWDWAAQRILTAYHDPLIQASFLRAARAEELRMELTPELRAAIDEAFYAIRAPTRPYSPMLAAEHKWAALSQKYAPPMRRLLIGKADEAIRGQLAVAGSVNVEPIAKYLDILERELLLPAQRNTEPLASVPSATSDATRG